MFLKFILVVFITAILFCFGYLKCIYAEESTQSKDTYPLNYQIYAQIRYLNSIYEEHKKYSNLIKTNETIEQHKREDRNYLIKRHQDDDKNIHTSVEYEEEKPSD